MAKVSDMFPSKWLTAAEVEGQVHQLVISAYGKESYDEGDKMTLSFQGAKKGMVLNHTNRGTLVWLFGDEADNWIGQTVELFTEPVNFKGKISAGLKLRGIQTAQPAIQPRPAPVPTQPSPSPIGGPGQQAAAQAQAVAQPMAADPSDLDDAIPF